MEGLLVTHDGKRYFLRPEILELCHVSDADLKDLQKGQPLPTGPVVPLASREQELSEESLTKVAGGLSTVIGGTGITHTTSTIMCPAW